MRRLGRLRQLVRIIVGESGRRESIQRFHEMELHMARICTLLPPSTPVGPLEEAIAGSTHRAHRASVLLARGLPVDLAIRLLPYADAIQDLASGIRPGEG